MKLIFAVFSLSLLSASAQAACDLKQNKQFDFWLGDWQVSIADGTVVGHNTITKSLANCVVTEHYTTPSGYEGNSLNAFDRQTGLWHQTWMDNGGLVLTLNGVFDGESMILSGSGKSAEGETILHRISWTANANNSVRQHWENSSDDGAHWSTVFDGHYTKIP